MERIKGFTKSKTCYAIRPPWLPARPAKAEEEDDAQGEA
jgi:hypothetical protein